MVTQLNLTRKSWDRIALDEYQEETRLEVAAQAACCFKSGIPTLRVEKRIGSDSMNAVVYLLTTRGSIRMAGKIMPVFSEKSVENNKKEMEIASLASNAVLKGLSSHFPILYGTAHCDHITYDEHSKHIDPSLSYWLRQKIKGIEGKRAAIVFDTDTFYMTTKEKESYVQNKLPGEDLSSPHASGDILLSELAWGDLDFFLLKRKDSLQTLVDIYSVIIEVVIDMQFHLRVVHYDLHPGNILVVLNVRGADLLATDFGTARVQLEIGDEGNIIGSDQLYDIYHITAKLIESHFPKEENSKFGRLLGDMYDYIVRGLIDTKTTMNDVLDYWNRLMKK